MESETSKSPEPPQNRPLDVTELLTRLTHHAGQYGVPVSVKGPSADYGKIFDLVMDATRANERSQAQAQHDNRYLEQARQLEQERAAKVEAQASVARWTSWGAAHSAQLTTAQGEIARLNGILQGQETRVMLLNQALAEKSRQLSSFQDNKAVHEGIRTLGDTMKHLF